MTAHPYFSVLDMFSIGLGPSSSHTVGPMRAAASFARSLQGLPVTRVLCSLHGSLADTGMGHGTDCAVLLGLSGEHPETTEVDKVPSRIARIRESGEIRLPDGRLIPFEESRDLVFIQGKPLPRHPNGMRFSAMNAGRDVIADEVMYSVGGGFIVSERHWEQQSSGGSSTVPYPFQNAKDLLQRCVESGLSIAELVLENEVAVHQEERVLARLDEIWQAMKDCMSRGMKATGTLPGGLNVARRAKSCHEALLVREQNSVEDPLTILDWVNLYALAVNEENAAGGRVVTAPTNGAAGIIPAVLQYAVRFRASPYVDGVHRFLLTAGAIASLYKHNASLSGADVGCQGEVGVACSMAAGALTEFLGGTPQQVEFAAEIGMEHNLGLTCDPIGGLVQIPCIERNAMGAVKAINASRLAIAAESAHYVSLDKVIQTMMATGQDMKDKYKETARGGLAVNVVEC